MSYRKAALATIVSLFSVMVAFAMTTSRSGGFENSFTDSDRLFTLQVLPLLKAKCLACHGSDPEDLKGGLDVSTLQGLLEGGESEGPSIEPGDPDASPLFQAICWDGLEMPPKENDRLSDAEIEYFREWIEAGAPWPDAERQAEIRAEEWLVPENENGIIVETSGGDSDEWTYRRYQPEDIWAIQPVVRRPVAQGFTNPIDSFISLKLLDEGIEPAGRADPRTLIRRASYDLTGLPPTPEQISEFEDEWNQDRHAAWEDLIERLLASPQYGERWGRHWLDVVRYADTSGFANDWERSNAWRYRDYVIRSFNEDKPYNQFVLEQLAGDELAPDNPEMLVATGFLRMGAWEHTPMTPAPVSRQMYLDDAVNAVGQTFMSTALRCCKCHDHKFDPIPTRDYYRIYAALATTQPAERPAAFLDSEDQSGFEENRKLVET